MKQLKPITTVTSFSRGSELWLQQARLLSKSLLTVLVIAAVFGGLVGGVYFSRTTSEDDLYALRKKWYARWHNIVPIPNRKMNLLIGEKEEVVDVEQVLALTEVARQEANRNLYNACVISSLTAIGFFCLVSMYWWNYGRNKMSEHRLRGAALVSGEDLKLLLNARKDASPYLIADVPMRRGSENLHTLIAGAQGTGKSQQFFSLMRQVRASGKRAIVYDPSGEFTQAFYREGIDVLMNPLDSRSPNWNIWTEIDKSFHFDSMANSLIPDPAESDPFWAKAGRMVLKDVYKVLGNQGKRTNRDLYQAVAISNLADMHALLAGEAGASYVDPVTERTGMSLKMTVQNQLKSFRFLHDEGALFSVRQWIREEDSSWMFITGNEELRGALSPVLSLWIDTAMKAVLSLEPIHRERLWFFVDELPTLQKLDILKTVLTNTRKYGLCCVIGVQDFSQLYEIYGHDLAKTIISGCQTKLLLRVTDGSAAKLMSELIGQAEVQENSDSLTYGLSSSHDGVTVSGKRQLKDMVLASEILTLPDMHGYLLVPGDYPIAKVSYCYVPSPKIAEGFVERKGFATAYASHPSGSSNVDPSVFF